MFPYLRFLEWIDEFCKGIISFTGFEERSGLARRSLPGNATLVSNKIMFGYVLTVIVCLSIKPMNGF